MGGGGGGRGFNGGKEAGNRGEGQDPSCLSASRPRLSPPAAVTVRRALSGASCRAWPIRCILSSESGAARRSVSGLLRAESDSRGVFLHRTQNAWWLVKRG